MPSIKGYIGNHITDMQNKQFPNYRRYDIIRIVKEV